MKDMAITWVFFVSFQLVYVTMLSSTYMYLQLVHMWVRKIWLQWLFKEKLLASQMEWKFLTSQMKSKFLTSHTRSYFMVIYWNTSTVSYHCYNFCNYVCQWLKWWCRMHSYPPAKSDPFITSKYVNMYKNIHLQFCCIWIVIY